MGVLGQVTSRVADAASQQPITGVTLGGTFMGSWFLHLAGILPVVTGIIAALGGTIGIVYYLIGIWESETVRTWRAKRDARRKLHRISKLKAEERVIAAELAMLDAPAAAQPMKDAASAALRSQVPIMPDAEKKPQ
jgi:hypothetical protein